MDPIQEATSIDFIEKEANARNRYILHYSNSKLPSYVWWSDCDIYRKSLVERLDWWEQEPDEDFSAISNCQEIIYILEKAVALKRERVNIIRLCSKRMNLPKLIEESIIYNLFN